MGADHAACTRLVIAPLSLRPPDGGPRPGSHLPGGLVCEHFEATGLEPVAAGVRGHRCVEDVDPEDGVMPERR